MSASTTRRAPAPRIRRRRTTASMPTPTGSPTPPRGISISRPAWRGPTGEPPAWTPGTRCSSADRHPALLAGLPHRPRRKRAQRRAERLAEGRELRDRVLEHRQGDLEPEVVGPRPSARGDDHHAALDLGAVGEGDDAALPLDSDAGDLGADPDVDPARPQDPGQRIADLGRL